MFSSHLHPKPIQIAFERSLTVVLDNDQQYYPFTGFIHSIYHLFISLIIATSVLLHECCDIIYNSMNGNVNINAVQILMKIRI